MEGSLVAYKVFTNGSTLQASELNENLMRQSVAVFSNAAARTAAITSPVEGQLTYLEDTNLFHYWNGSAWISPFGATLLASVNFTSQSSVSLSNVFTSEFTNYRLLLNVTGFSTGTDIRFRLRDNTTDNTSTFYATTGIYTNVPSSAVNNYSSAYGQTSGLITGGNNSASAAVDIFNPNVASKTYLTHQSTRVYGDMSWLTGGSYFDQSTVFNGITIFPFSGSITGNIRLYGMRDA